MMFIEFQKNPKQRLLILLHVKDKAKEFVEDNQWQNVSISNYRENETYTIDVKKKSNGSHRIPPP